ncbi:hypothetical protein JCM19241_3569 [Vibrio ishigakensis]|uniref:DUF2971 domain-containing protein n=1 Tax=Vibrio ishigakensis TaxID=1481914 RepID=A0A0B8QF33_9VIBR|nr:hypothetical protein JCM19241_3569 [Vibrio ishigakensis]
MKTPDILYKYTTADTTQIILDTGRLRWQSPCQFNDISELQRMPLLSPSFVEARPIYARKLLEIVYSSVTHNTSAYSQWTQKLIGLLSQWKQQGVSADSALSAIESVIPLSEQNIENVFRQSTERNNDGSLRCFCLTENEMNTLMWAHYGDSSRGCMLGFRHIEELSTPFAAAEKVRYSDDVPVIGSAVDFYLYGPTRDQNRETRLAIYHTKTKDWEYEKEWRVIYKNKAKTDKKYTDYKFYPSELESITFGLKIDAEKKAKILDLIASNYSHCDLYELKMTYGVVSRIKF